MKYMYLKKKSLTKVIFKDSSNHMWIVLLYVNVIELSYEVYVSVIWQQSDGYMTLRKIANGNFFEKKNENFWQFFLKNMSSFWQFFDIQMTIFRKVRSLYPSLTLCIHPERRWQHRFAYCLPCFVMVTMRSSIFNDF